MSDIDITLTDNADSIHIIVDGVDTAFAGESASMTIPADATYARIEAWKNIGWADRNGGVHDVTDVVFSNPIMLRPETLKSAYNDFMLMVD